ncbi:hypothetical protein E2C01_050776 [Portunus trituberculatus]|uniref:Uncharacterized protein n=1 Tax=Portunus trituberculatus TaxID=210409 RepID=A0A5B7GH11_PORTR|nr:hypothetical protein [Portunus trituberculatus]
MSKALWMPLKCNAPNVLGDPDDEFAVRLIQDNLDGPWTGAFTGIQGKEEFNQRKLCAVVRVYASHGKVWDSEICCLLARKEDKVIQVCDVCLCEMLGYCVGNFIFVVYQNIV